MDAHLLRIDDFETHEEDGRLQDQPNDEQQQQLLEEENEDEDSNNDEGEGEAEQDEVGVDDTNLRSIYDQQRFERACKHIHENDSDVVEFDCESPLDDCRAVLLGSSLIGNTELKELCIDLTFTYQDRLRSQGKAFTSRGARAITGGIVGSQVKSLFLWGEVEEELPLEMSHLCARSIEELHLRFCVEDEFAVQLCESLTVCKLLRHFTLQLNYSMTPLGAQALSNFLRSSPISTLEFIVVLDDAATMSTMQTLYLEGVLPSRNIQNLLLYGVLGDMHTLATIILPKLQALSFQSVELSLSDVELLTCGLRDAHQIHKLSLCNCELGGRLSVLSPVLGNHPSLKNVTLDNNFHGNACVATFVEHWRPETIIEELILSGNVIGPKGAALLIQASANHPTFHSLDLCCNIFIGFDGLKLIGEALPNAKLHKLDLVNMVSWIEYDDDACEAAVIQEAKRRAAGKALLEGVRANGHLLEMRLGESHLPMNVVEEINLYVNANALGRRAALENQHALPSGVWSHFFVKEGMSSSLLFLFLRELPGVVMGGSCSSTIGRKRRRA